MIHERDEVRLQRLVDGALSDVERRDFLSDLEGRPHLWRELALAFVEEQIWEEAVPGAGLSERKSAPSVTPAAVAACTRAQWLTWGAITVALIVMFGVGMEVGRWNNRQLANPPVDWQLADERVIQVDPGVEPVAPEPQVVESSLYPEQLQIEYGDGPSRRSMVVPVYHASQQQGDEWDDEYAEELKRLNRELASLGYRIEWQTEYLGGSLPEGNQLVVPVRAISLRQRGQ
jgi:hypothetical protein